MLDAFFFMLKIVLTGIVLFVVAQLFQGKPVAPWAAWLTSIIVVTNLSMAASPRKKD